MHFVNADTVKKKVADFVDSKKDPMSYVKRYQNEPIYKSWFDKNYGLKYKSIYEAVGLPEPTKTTTKTTDKTKTTKTETLLAKYTQYISMKPVNHYKMDTTKMLINS